MQHDPSPISDQFGDQTPEHREGEEPSPPFDAHDNVDHQRGSEKRDECRVGRYRRTVLVDAVFGGAVVRTGGEGAIGVGAVDDEASVAGGGS